MNKIDSSYRKTILQCKQLTKVFREGKQSTPVLNQIDFSLQSQERIAIIGASGSGKSTLLHILGCLDHATQGSVQILQHIITTYNERQLTQIRKQYIGFIYQFHHLLPEFTLLENIQLPLFIQGKSPDIIQPAVWHILEKLGLEKRAHYKPSEVSGGERQRTAIGRAMITRPLFILADEPTGNLDYHTAHQIIELLCTIQESSLIIVTHDTSIAQRMDRILELENGQLVTRSF